MKNRIDNLLVSLGYATSRTKAQDLIDQECVYYSGQIVKKSSFNVIDIEQLEVKNPNLYVSRSAQKIITALDSFNINVAGKIACDVGASTGGFTQVLLERGINHVYCVDVGHNQLDEKIKSDSRVTNYEGINIRDGVALFDLVDLVVADLSFISLRLVLDQIMELVKSDGDVIVLFKPQFEVGREKIGKNGIVDDTQGAESLMQFIEWCFVKYNICAHVPSQIRGKTGNQEYLIWLKRK